MNGVTVSPYPPVKGIPLTFNFDLTVKEQIEGGSIVVDLKAGDVVPVPIKVNDDLCADLAQIGGVCPVPVGPFTFTISDETIPKLFPEKHVYGNVGGHPAMYVHDIVIRHPLLAMYVHDIVSGH